MNDQIDQAIAAAAEPPPPPRAQHNLTMHSGKVFSILYPIDMTDREVLEVCATLMLLLPQLMEQHAKGPAARIIVPR